MKKTFKTLAYILAVAMVFSLAVVPMSVTAVVDNFEFTPNALAEEDAEIGAVAGTLSADTNGSPIFTLTAGSDNFEIDGDEVKLVKALEAGTYSITVKVEDSSDWDEDTATFTIRISEDPTDPTGDIPGSSTLTEVPLNVILPLNLNFAIDPFDFAGKGQINSPGYAIVNKTGIAVKVTFDIEATAAGVTFVADPTTLKPADSTEDSKNAYFATLAAASVSPAPTFDSPKQGTYTYDTVAADTVVANDAATGFDATDKDAKIVFILDKATESDPGESGIDTLATSTGGVGAFKFTGFLNTYAEWEANSISVLGAYTIVPLGTDAYTIDAAKKIATTLNMQDLS